MRAIEGLLPLDVSTFVPAFWVQVWFEASSPKKRREILKLARRGLAEYREAGVPLEVISLLEREITTLEQHAPKA